ncbi:DUF6538 domain-containing protein [Boseongicola aestuarii]|uniref:Tyrosine recombinase XerC n=1 Tax=Boseongicola aestuarii TaxID=1470561 RepID=A0A238J163_9RHOB|nr:DUF6538 domain-containing protein [Boseongicola aestuarii]SMX23644.1 Tyrosine recombinase XerC [Boseongicola aestuarii]
MNPPASLVMVKGKWNVQITVPKEHRAAVKNQKQLRVSTGTTDKKIAERLKHEKAQELYNKLPDPIAELEERVEELNKPVWAPEDEEEAYEWERQDEKMDGRRKEVECLEQEIAELRAERNSYVLTVRELADRWLESDPYPSRKTRKEAETAIEEFIRDNGNLTVGKLSAQTGYDWAEELGKDKGNKTLRKKIGYVSGALSWGERKGLVQSNPFFGLKLSLYGKKTQSYLPLTSKELRELFAQDMPDNRRLLLEILATTGMRLDEAALLNWEDVKEEDGVVYFDLTDHDKPIKTIGSRRKVPVPETLKAKLPTGKTGQMFPEHKRNSDGKAQGPASRALMPYIRSVTKDRRKTLHSLRGTLKDKLRDADVSKETNDFITGHGTGDVSGKYGVGPSLKVRKAALDKPNWDGVVNVAVK